MLRVLRSCPISEHARSGQVKRDPGCAASVVPRNVRGIEPLAAPYRRDSHDLLAEAFRGSVRKVTDALARISVETGALENMLRRSLGASGVAPGIRLRPGIASRCSFRSLNYRSSDRWPLLR